jgi:hypothetical protein
MTNMMAMGLAPVFIFLLVLLSAETITNPAHAIGVFTTSGNKRKMDPHPQQGDVEAPPPYTQVNENMEPVTRHARLSAALAATRSSVTAVLVATRRFLLRGQGAVASIPHHSEPEEQLLRARNGAGRVFTLAPVPRWLDIILRVDPELRRRFLDRHNLAMEISEPFRWLENFRGIFDGFSSSQSLRNIKGFRLTTGTPKAVISHLEVAVIFQGQKSAQSRGYQRIF